MKKVKLTLIGLDSNAFAIMGAFQKAARRQGWTQEEIKKVLDDAKNGDYDHFLSVIMNHCEDED